MQTLFGMRVVVSDLMVEHKSEISNLQKQNGNILFRLFCRPPTIKKVAVQPDQAYLFNNDTLVCTFKQYKMLKEREKNDLPRQTRNKLF